MHSDPWQFLSQAPAEALRPARLELHRAAQLAACAGQSLLTKRSDDSQMALTWKDGILFGEPLPGGARVGLALADLALEVRDQHRRLRGRLPLDGRTPGEALRWMKEILGSREVDTSNLRLEMPYELPGGAGQMETLFSAKAAGGLDTLAAWYGASAQVLAFLAEGRPDASSLRCWPHHFDLAALLTLDPGQDTETARSIGLGFSPGDGSYDEPYFYVTPWPYPVGLALPAIPNGHWHTEHWTGAVLTAAELAAAPDFRAQATAFLEGALQACEALLR